MAWLWDNIAAGLPFRVARMHDIRDGGVVWQYCAVTAYSRHFCTEIPIASESKPELASIKSERCRPAKRQFSRMEYLDLVLLKDALSAHFHLLQQGEAKFQPMKCPPRPPICINPGVTSLALESFISAVIFLISRSISDSLL